MTKIFFTNFRIFLEIWSKFIFENCPSYEKTNKIICIKNEDFFLARNRFFWISYLRKANELSTTIVVLPGSAAAHPSYTYCVFWFRDFFDNFLGLIKNKLYLKIISNYSILYQRASETFAGPTKTWQVCMMSMIYFVLAVGNTTTLFLTLNQKEKRKRARSNCGSSESSKTD